MNNDAASNRAPGSDPLLVTTGANRPADPIAPASRNAPRDSARRVAGSGTTRRQHPARGARALALAASVLATGAVAAALGYSDGAWGADSDASASGSADQLIGSTTSSTTTTVTVNDSSAATSTVTADTPSTTPSTTANSATTTETTQPATDTATSSGYTDGVYLGSAEYTEWGDVQVQVTISDGEIVDIAAVQYPTGRKSSNINEQAIPMLEADAVAIQSADLDIVSGATYTSRTYADSLQAALDQAASAISQDEGSS